MSFVVRRGPVIYSFLDTGGRVVRALAGDPYTRLAFEPLCAASAGPFTLVMRQDVEFEPERCDPRMELDRAKEALSR